MLEALGWVATLLFAASYFTRESVHLRRIQAVAALLWISYGIAIGSLPVVVSNLIVASLAAYSSLKSRAGNDAVQAAEIDSNCAR
jgi:hypothetical protein